MPLGFSACSIISGELSVRGFVGCRLDDSSVFSKLATLSSRRRTNQGQAAETGHPKRGLSFADLISNQFALNSCYTSY